MAIPGDTSVATLGEVETAMKGRRRPGRSLTPGERARPLPSCGTIATMGRMSALAAALVGVSACGSAGDGGIREFAQYSVVVEAKDQPDLNTTAPARELMFRFDGDDANTRQQCAWFGDATATFAGRPVTLTSPGGWDTYQIPTNTAPGQFIPAASCEQPFIDVTFENPVGEPQNGVLAVDGSGLRFEVPFMRDFGSPEVTLVSSATGSIVLGLAGFPRPPTLADADVSLSSQQFGGGGLANVNVAKTSLDANGQLALTPMAGAIVPPFIGYLSVSVNLGSDVLACRGFMKCTATSRVVRSFEIDFANPP